MSDRLPGWIRRRVTLAAQRTRWHTAEELDALWAALEAHLLTGAVAKYGLYDLLDVDVPTLHELASTTLDCLAAVKDGLGLSWKPLEANR